MKDGILGLVGSLKWEMIPTRSGAGSEMYCCPTSLIDRLNCFHLFPLSGILLHTFRPLLQKFPHMILVEGIPQAEVDVPNVGTCKVRENVIIPCSLLKHFRFSTIDRPGAMARRTGQSSNALHSQRKRHTEQPDMKASLQSPATGYSSHSYRPILQRTHPAHSNLRPGEVEKSVGRDLWFEKFMKEPTGLGEL